MEPNRRDGRAEGVRQDLVAALRSDFEIVNGLDSSAAHTVVIGDRYSEAPIRGKASTVSLSSAAIGAHIVAVDAPRTTPPATAIHVAVDVESSGPSGGTSVLTVAARGVQVARATHRWTSDRELWRAELDAVPVGEPPFVLHLELSPASDGGAGGAADAVVFERRDPLRVLVYEARPSWASTFVRRALESDPRFRVSAVSYASRNVAERMGLSSSLAASAPEEFDAVVVGGLDTLTAADVEWLDRFARARGGALALVPDARFDSGPARTWIAELTMRETLVERPAALAVRAPLPRLDASEILTMRPDTPSVAEVLAHQTGSDDPAIVTIPRGDGEVMVSGALDAWRFRADPGVEFDAFWRAAIARLALAAHRDVEVDVSPRLLAPGDAGRVTVRVRGPLIGAPVSARLVSGGVGSQEDRPIRLWPAAAPGVFTGGFTAPLAAGGGTVRVSVDPARPHSGMASFLVGHVERAHASDDAPLSLLSASHGGIDVDSDHLGRLEAFLRTAVTRESIPEARHPMRSAWWLVPFASCLSGEWWLRRRRGLR